MRRAFADADLRLKIAEQRRFAQSPERLEPLVSLEDFPARPAVSNHHALGRTQVVENLLEQNGAKRIE
jgi:hypothetical protein